MVSILWNVNGRLAILEWWRCTPYRFLWHIYFTLVYLMCIMSSHHIDFCQSGLDTVFSWAYPVVDLHFLCLCFNSLLLSYTDSMYRKDKSCNVLIYGVILAVPVLLLVLSSVYPLNSGSIMLSGCWVNTERKWEVGWLLRILGPLKAKASKYSTSQGISTDYGHNRELNHPFTDLTRLIVKSIWILKNINRRFWASVAVLLVAIFLVY